MATATKERATKHNASNNNAVAAANNDSLIFSLVINGDLSKLSPEQKVDYYRQYCERLNLDPMGQPFKLLRLNGRETLYCDRSGAQQLNKLHDVSHEITARETIYGCYVVTAQAMLPDGRHTESIGAVPIDNLKGDALCNAMMKAETKAKRRATLDLLGLGILDETEAAVIPGAEVIPTTTIEDVKDEAVGKINPFKMGYTTAKEVEDILKTATDIKDVANLYYVNAELVEANPELKAKFSDKKNQFYNANNLHS